MTPNGVEETATFSFIFLFLNNQKSHSDFTAFLCHFALNASYFTEYDRIMTL